MNGEAVCSARNSLAFCSGVRRTAGYEAVAAAAPAIPVLAWVQMT